jgi:hypothetical protein
MRNIVVAVIVSILSVRGNAILAQSTCHAQDQRSDHFIAVVKQMMGPDGAPARAHLGLGIVDTTQILIVSDSAICARAGQALDSLNLALNPGATIPPPDTLPLYVLQVGSSFAVADLNYSSTNDFDHLFFFTSLWQFMNVGVL